MDCHRPPEPVDRAPVEHVGTGRSSKGCAELCGSAHAGESVPESDGVTRRDDQRGLAVADVVPRAC